MRTCFALIIILLVSFTTQPVFADDATSTPDIASSTPDTASSTPLTIEGHVDVPANCEAVDTDGATHDYLAASSTNYLAICAVEAAKDAGLITDIGLSNQFPAFGLFITEINGFAADPSSQYWAILQNGGFAPLGITSLPLEAGDTLELQLHDFSDNDLGDDVTLHIDSLIATSSATTTPAATSTPPEENSSASSTDSIPSTSSGQTGSGGGGDGISHSQLNIASAVLFLTSKQKSDGSFDSDLLTDWAALAFAASDPGEPKTKLHAYLVSSSPALQSTTDYERHAMALEALGIDPSTGTSVNTIVKIVSAFDGAQIGDPSLVNDDIFAVFPLIHAGYGTSDSIIQKTVAFIVAKQKVDGSWDESVDLTAAAIQALLVVSSLPNVNQSIARGENYLHSKQQSDGGFGNSFSTSWALQAIAALNEPPSAWAPIGYTPQDYLAQLQQNDGGVEPVSTALVTRVWATEYAIPAAAMKTWDSLLGTFSRAAVGSTNAGGAATSNATSTEATSTQPLATTIPLSIEPATSSTPAVTVAPTTYTTPSKLKTHTVPVRKKQSPSPALSNFSSTPTPQTQAVVVAATQGSAPNVFVKIWHFFAHLFGL